MTSIRPTFLTGGIAAALRSPASIVGAAATTTATAPTAPPVATAPVAPPPPAAPPFVFQPPSSPFVPTAPVAPPPGAPAAESPPPAAPATTFTAVRPNLAALNPAVLGTLIQPVRPLPPVLTAPPPTRSVTQVAQDAIAQLRSAPSDVLTEAVRVLQAKNVKGKEIISLLERRTRIGEVLSGSATRWSAETVGDFAAVFQMDATRTATMDLIVAIGVLNDQGVEAEVRMENLPPSTPEEFLQNRRVVFQYPPPGTELTPPYVILVAVESQDFALADQAVSTIYGQLIDHLGYRLPRDAAARLG